MERIENLQDKRLQPKIPEQSPAHLPKPHWLKEGEYNGPSWGVVDDAPSSPNPLYLIRWDIQLFDQRRQGGICRLTDPEYANLLDTAKRQSYGLRTGKHATVTSACAHEDMSRMITNFIIWMVQNGIYRFSYLDQDDFDVYVEAVSYGPGHLLRYGPRLVEYVKGLREAGLEVPGVKRSNTKPYLDSTKLLESAGIDPPRGLKDKATTFELLKIAKEEGFYLAPVQIKRLSGMPPEPHRLVVSRLLRMLQPWDYQFRMRHDLPGDRIQFNPFDDITPLKMAQELGEKQGRTKTAPVQQTMELIDCSIRWVLDYAPVLLDLRDQYYDLAVKGLNNDERYNRMSGIIARAFIPNGPGSPFPLNASTKKSVAEGLDFGTAINVFIPSACVTVISTFSARRHKEVMSIRAKGQDNEDCITRDGSGFWIETYIEKTIQDWRRTPCNEIVAAAVKILYRWSAPARVLSGEVNLFQYKLITSNEVARFHLAESLNAFVQFLNLTPLPDGTHWVFKPHQFRRFFAIAYFWRYQYRNLAALSYHLRHFDPAMTQLYVTELDTGAIFRHVDRDHTATILTEAALGRRNISGPLGERFKNTAGKLRDHYRRLTKVVSPRLVRKVVERYIGKSGRRLKAMLWGYCACGPLPHQLTAARCLENGSARTAAGPDFSRSTAAVCCSCPHHVTEVVFEPFLRSEIESHKRAAADLNNGPILREASREYIEKLQRHYQRSFINSKPLEIISE